MEKTFWQARLLLVDDEIFVRRIVRRMVADLPFAVIEEAENGDEALNKARKLKPDIIICDHHMPELDGLHFIKKVRSGAEKVRHETAIIMLTGDPDDAVFRSALALDVDAFIAKPVGKDTLTEKIKRCFDNPQTVKKPEEYAGIELPGDNEEVVQWPEAQFDPATMLEKTIDQIKIGEKLACDLKSKDGALLLAAGQEITKATLARMQDLVEMGSIGSIAVWK